MCTLINGKELTEPGFCRTAVYEICEVKNHWVLKWDFK